MTHEPGDRAAERKLLFYLYVPLGGDTMLDLRIYGPGPLTQRHLEVLLRYLDVMRYAVGEDVEAHPAPTDTGVHP
jgi:hypothetical protein